MLAFIAGLLCLFCHVLVAAPAFAEVTLQERDRVLVLAPHPDDEILGCAGVIQQAVARGLPVRIVFLTYGDHNEVSFIVSRKHPVVMPEAARRMGLIRHDEAIAAAKVLDLPMNHLTFLGYPDLGTLPIWCGHWKGQPAFHSRLTDTSTVPYPNALRAGAPYRGEEILRDLEGVFREFGPTKIFVSHPADHHPDHRALYLFATVAWWNVWPEKRPEVLPYLVHYKQWPEPKGMRGDLPLEPPAALREQISWAQKPLLPEVVQRKQAALQAHRTQYEYSSHRLLALVRANELFGNFPVLDGRIRDKPQNAGRAQGFQEPPEELTREERRDLQAVHELQASVDKDELLLIIHHSRPIAEGLEVFAFGYRSDTAFGTMPKLQIKMSVFGHEPYDADKRLPKESVVVQSGAGRTTIRIPLKLLGHPSRVFTTARTYVGELPFDWTAWRILEVPGGDGRK